MSDFKSLAGLARASVEAVHGDAATVLPMDREAGPNGRRSPSLVRMPFAVVALDYREAESVMRDMSAGFPRAQNAGGILRAGRHTASIRAGIQNPVEGDLIRYDDTGATHEIMTIDPDGLGHLTLTLSASRVAT